MHISVSYSQNTHCKRKSYYENIQVVDNCCLQVSELALFIDLKCIQYANYFITVIIITVVPLVHREREGEADRERRYSIDLRICMCVCRHYVLNVKKRSVL